MDRPRIKLSEMKDGWAEEIILTILVGMGLLVFVFGGLTAYGLIEKPLPEGQYAALVEDQPTYEEYVDAFNQRQLTNGVVYMAVGGPALSSLGFLFWWATTTMMTKCPKGHVIRKKDNWCSECGERVYTREELSQLEWAKRYGENHGVH